MPYLFALLGIEEQPSPLQQMDPQIRRRRTFEALKKLFLRESLNQPLILIFEDLHWIDSETQGFLDTLSESVATARILLLGELSPRVSPGVGAEDVLHPTAASRRWAKRRRKSCSPSLLGNDASLTAVKQLILEKTEGTPFFMEEVVQTLAEEGALLRRTRATTGWSKRRPSCIFRPPSKACSPRVLTDSPPDEKALLQQLAVIGREFPLSLMRQVVTQPEDELYRLLASLQRKEFLYEQPAFPEVEYIFKHALTQEVAYNSVLQERRKALHEQTAQAIEALYHATLRRSLQRVSPSLQRAVATPRRRWSTSAWQDNKPCSARPMRKRSVISPLL